MGSVTVMMTTDAAVPGPGGIGNSGVIEATLDGSFTGFSNSVFTPQVAMTDCISLGSASSFTIQFAAPVTDPILQIHEFADSKLSFYDSGGALTFQLLSSDGHFDVPDGGTGTSIRGQALANDASGSLLFTGTHTQIRWSAGNANSADGMGIQMSTVPEPSTLTLALTAGLFAAALRRFRFCK